MKPCHNRKRKSKFIVNGEGRFNAAFTLVELLTVIAIIAILAAMILPVLSAVKTHAKKVQARLEEQDIVTAVQAYDSAYARLPVSAAAQAAAKNSDYTYGGTFTVGQQVQQVFILGSHATNADVIAILMNITNYPGTSTPTINTNSQRNPQQTIFLNARMNGDTNAAANLTPGVGADLVYRDPWGNPYVITMDLNYDEMCKDAFYCKNAVSLGGLNGLVNQDGSGATSDNWQSRGKVMVWSAGPDGGIDPTVPANQGFNKDNVLSWQ